MAEHELIATGLPVAEAKPLLDKAMASYVERFAKYEPTFAWNGDHVGKFGFRALGARVSGQLTLRDGAVEVTLDVPLRLRPFRGKALDVIRREIGRWVSEAG